MLSPRITQRRLDREHAREQAAFDSISAKEAAEKLGANPINERMAKAATEQMRVNALMVTFMLASLLSEDDFDDAELLPSELLDTLMLEAFELDEDDESDALDEVIKTTFSAHIADALSTLSVADDVIDDVFSDDVEVADAACLNAAETVLENMPDDGDDFDDFVATFVYSDYDEEMDESGFDGMNDGYDGHEYQFDAAGKKKLRAGKKTVKKVNGKTLVYKAVKAMRNGKVTVVNKRVSGNIKLSAAQKGALRKARRKSSTSSAIRKQMRSLAKGIRKNIYKNSAGLKGLQNAALRRHSKSIGI